MSETNRANAQHSTGPRTESGKQRTRLNALRHGLTGQTIVLPSDDLAAYQRHCQELHDHYHPKNKMEVLLTQTIADLTWRLNRIAAIETNLLTLGITDTENGQAHTALLMAAAFRKESQTLANLSIYERRLSLRLKDTLKQLTEMQENKHDAAKNSTEDGFVFSKPFVARAPRPAASKLVSTLVNDFRTEQPSHHP